MLFVICGALWWHCVLFIVLLLFLMSAVCIVIISMEISLFCYVCAKLIISLFFLLVLLIGYVL